MPIATKFPLGKIVATPGALQALKNAEISLLPFLRRHAHGDWGNLHQDDQLANERALRCGMRILSAYALHTGDRIWIITEADRSSTTLLMPEEY